MGASKLAIASDSAEEVDAVNFRAYDGVKVWHGTFGLAKRHLAQGEQLKKKSDLPDQKASAALANTLLGTVQAFCTDSVGESRTGWFNGSLFNTIKNSVLFTVFFGAPYAQLTGLILCREHFKNALASEKDKVRDFMRIVGEAAKKDSDVAKICFELFSKQHALIKDLHHAPTMKQDWLQWQQTVLDAEGHQSGSGQ